MSFLIKVKHLTADRIIGTDQSTVKADENDNLKSIKILSSFQLKILLGENSGFAVDGSLGQNSERK